MKEKNRYQEELLPDFRALVRRSAEKFGERTAFLLKRKDRYKSISYRAFRSDFYALCNAFLDRGLLGKRIAVIGGATYAWVLSYLAAATVGVVVPLDKELSAKDICNFVDLAECAAICIDDEIMEKERIEFRPEVRTFSFARIQSLAVSVSAATERVDRLTVDPNEMRILLFTSGTTGYAKGVCLSQKNILSNIYSTVSVVKITPKDRVMSILPLHHTYECTLDCLLILSRGACITYAESLAKVQKNMLEYSPTVLVVVPALLNVLHKRILTKIKRDLPEKYRPAFEALPFDQAMQGLPFPVRKIVQNKVKIALGGKLRLFIVGAAKLDREIVDDFMALGVRTLQGYGLTECSPLLAGNTDFWFHSASTGKAVPGVELKIHEPNTEGVGEILARGDNIMLGYWNDPEETARVLADGWFHTGDLGYLDAEGFLYITGRCKNVIVAENGKNIYPEELETRLSAYAEVEEVIVVSCMQNGRTEIKAKIFPSVDFLREKLGHEPARDEIHARLSEIVEAVNCDMPDFKRIRILEVLTEALEKTTTRKVKRYGANLS